MTNKKVKLTVEEENNADSNREPVFKIRDLPAAKREPVSVKKDDKLSVALTKMMTHNFSQLPVLRNRHSLEGVISWQAIGERLALGQQVNPTEKVQNYMTKAVPPLRHYTSLTESIEKIIEYEFILVKDENGVVRGPITTSDLSETYHDLAEQFLLVRDLERSIRRILKRYASQDELKRAKKSGDSNKDQPQAATSDEPEPNQEPDSGAQNDHGDSDREVSEEELTIAHYLYLFHNEQFWEKLNIKLDQKVVTRQLEEARKARNQTMHFHTLDDASTPLLVLRNAARLFNIMADTIAPVEKPAEPDAEEEEAKKKK